MITPSKNIFKIAILDLYEGTANRGMMGIKNILHDFATKYQLNFEVAVFDVRLKQEIPTLDFDIFISSGGPGNPSDSKETEWEKKYFKWIADIMNFNKVNENKKHVFFICHSFQLACRFFNIASVNKRKSTSFGVFPVHLEKNGMEEPIFNILSNPFYAVDNRDYQVVQPNFDLLSKMQMKILAIEKERPLIPLERAVMAIRFSDTIIGTQFHPEANVEGMLEYLQFEKKELVILNHGEEKWTSMIQQLHDPEKIMLTYHQVLPNFLKIAVFNTINPTPHGS